MNRDRRPDWAYWKHCPELKVWEGVALSLDIDPRRVRHSGHVDFDESDEFKDRIGLTIRNTSADFNSTTPLHPIAGMGTVDPASWLITIAEFAPWAVTVFERVPGEFRALAAPAEKALASTERNTMLTIIAALCEYSAIKPGGRGAGTQIAKLTEDIGAPVSDDTVRKVLAQVAAAVEGRRK